MKLAMISLLLAAAPAFAADAPKADAPKAEAKKAASKDPYKTDDERSIYTYGFLMGRNLAPFNLTPAEVKIIQAGIADSVLNAPPKIDVRFYQPRIQELVTKRVEAAAAKEKEKGRAYVEKFVKESKPQAIPGGGWYLETKAGDGPTPSPTATVKAHYRGTLVDGTEFDSSYSRNAPYEFSLAGGVIQCWLKAFPLIKAGGKGKLVCPTEVAYKDEARPPHIKPGATLLFDVELVEIVKP